MRSTMVATHHAKPRRCTKNRYRDEISARYALAVIQYSDNTGRPKTEQRAYYCNRCHGWHLTSQEKRR